MEQNQNKPNIPKPIDRRSFLKIFGGGILSAWLGQGCSTPEEQPKTERLSKQEKVSRQIPLPEQIRKPSSQSEIMQLLDQDDSPDAEAIDEIFARVDVHKKVSIDMNVIEATVAYWEKRYKTKNFSDLKQTCYKMRYFNKQLKEIFSSQGLKEEVAYLCIPESEGTFRKTSPMGADGLYQLMPEIAQKSGLKMIEGLYDERYDPLLCAQTCAKNIVNLQKKFRQNFDLAISGYNGAFVWQYLIKKDQERACSSMSYADFLTFLEGKVNRFRTNLANNRYMVGERDSWESLIRMFTVKKTAEPVDKTIAKLPKKLLTKPDPAKEKARKRADQPFVTCLQELRASGATLTPGLAIQFPSDSTNRFLQQKNELLRKYIQGYKENINYPAKYYAVQSVIKESGLANMFPDVSLKWTEQQVEATRFQYMVQEGDDLNKIRKKVAGQTGQPMGQVATEEEIISTNNLKVEGKEERRKVHLPIGKELVVAVKKGHNRLIDFAKSEEDVALLQFLNPAIIDFEGVLPEGAVVKFFTPEQKPLIKEAMRAYEEGTPSQYVWWKPKEVIAKKSSNKRS